MIWVFVFGGIALAGLIMVVSYIVWLAHLTADVLSEVGVLGQRLGELGELAAAIEFPDPYASADTGYGRSPARSGVGSEYRTYDNEGVTPGRVGKEE